MSELREVFLKARCEELERQLAEAKAEIEEMRPSFEADKKMYESHKLFDGAAVPCRCFSCQRYREYESRKQP